jgi:hypothetical protein
MPTNTSRKLLVPALILVLGAAGCTAKAGTTPAGGGQDTDLKYSQCMRDQGLSWFPDPGADGGLRVSVPEGTDQSKVDKAEQACKAYAPGATRGGPLAEEDLDKLRQMSQCVREHGFEKYPDPDADGGIHLDSKTTGLSPDTPGFEKALQECRKLLPPKRSRGDS